LQNRVCVVEYVRCMGCGLCAAACPTGALRLERLSEDEMPVLPVDRHAWAERRLRGRNLLQWQPGQTPLARSLSETDEAICRQDRIEAVIEAIVDAHPYETPAIAVIPTLTGEYRYWKS
jgi:ferredoxin